MEITLKKALKVRGLLETYLKETTLPLTVGLSVFSSRTLSEPMTDVSAGTEKLAKAIEEKLFASSVLARLRSSIAKTNAEAGIEDLLAMQADVERGIAIQKMLVDAKLTPDAEIVSGEAAVVRNALTSSEATSRFGYQEKVVTVSAVSEEMRAAAVQALADLRRQREGLEDTRTGINAMKRIEIAEEDARFLTGLGII